MDTIENPTARRVEIMLDRQRHLLYDFNALSAIEDKIGEGESTLKAEFWKSISAKRCVIVLWAGLLHEDKALTVDGAKDLIAGKDVAWLLEKIKEAWGLSGPEAASPEDPTPAPVPPVQTLQ